MTDNEIVKDFTKTFEQYKEKGDCRTTVHKDILDLINRQKTEIERLNKENDRLSQCVLYHDGVTEMKVEEAKVKAIKEFWKKVRKYIKKEICFFTQDDEHDLEKFGDNLVKELTEISDGKAK